MAAKQIIDRVMYEEWEFDTAEELEVAATKEACVCGDSITRQDSVAKIYNFHQQGIRWFGRVKR
jgi:hypothetical protein